MNENPNAAFIEFIRSIPEGRKITQVSPGYIKIISKDGRNVHIYKEIDGEYKSCSYKRNPSKKVPSKIKTKKGKINIRGVSKIAALFVGCTLAFQATKELTKKSEKQEYPISYQIPETQNVPTIKTENIQIMIENYENNIPIPETIETESEEYEYIEEPVELESENIQTVPYEINQSKEIHYREKTKELYGPLIQEYASYFGLDANLAEALITQERDKNSLDNPGQLTRNICGEEIIIPMIHKKETDQKEVIKLYIVRDEPQKENFANETEYIEQLNRYKNQLTKSKELATKGYEIIYFNNLKGDYNIKENIRISLIWLSHCIYRCDCQLNKGIFAYNQGYPTANAYTDYEIMNGIAGAKNADHWYNYNVYQFLTKEEAANMTFTLKPFPSNWKYLSENQKNEYLNTELSQIQPKNITLTLPIFNETLEEKYDDEKENGHHL